MKNAPTGILSYGSYIPRYRIAVEAIAVQHGKDPEAIKRALGLREKTVPAPDEDSVTMGVEAGNRALTLARINPTELGALYSGSESKVYVVKPNATIVGAALGLGPHYMAADLEFACKAGTAALQIVYGLVRSGLIQAGMAIGSDTAQARPGDVLEYSAAAGAAAFILGSGEGVIAELEATVSSASDTPDFWRANAEPYPVHLGRFTGEPSYDAQITAAVSRLLAQLGAEPGDFDHVVFHTPNGKFPRRIGKKLGFTSTQLKAGFVVPEIGNTYSAASLLGLCAVLDVAEPGQRILLASYGSGAGSDAFAFRTTEAILDLPRDQFALRPQIQDKVMVDYETCLGSEP